MLASILDACVCELHRVSGYQHGRDSMHCAEKGYREAYIQGAQLSVWVLVADTLLQRAHSLLGRDRLGSDEVGNIEVESNVFTVSRCTALGACLDTEHVRGLGGVSSSSLQTAACSLRDLLIQGRSRRRRPPSHHVGRLVCSTSRRVWGSRVGGVSLWGAAAVWGDWSSPTSRAC